MYFINSFNKYLFKNRFNLRNRCFYRPFCSNSDNNQMIDEEVIKNERHFTDLNVKQFESLAKTSDDMKKIESILSVYEYQKYSTLEVPTTLKLNQMSGLLALNSSEEINKYLFHLYETEIQSLFNKKLKEIQKSLKRQELTTKWNKSCAERSGIFDNNGDIVYGLWHNSLFTRISPQYVRRYCNHRLRTASLFGQNIVFDLTCGPTMKSNECQTKLLQLSKSYSINKNRFREPFNLNFCNFDKNSILWKTIQQKSEMYSKSPHFLSDFTEKSYLDLFERKSLVYLTPNAEKQLNFDPKDVYVISFCDGFEFNNYLSIVSRKENIKIRRLPIDNYVFWSGFTKDLKSYTVLSILNDVREGIDWGKAIERNVPKNFIKSKEVIEKEEEYRLAKHIRQQKNLIDLKQIFE